MRTPPAELERPYCRPFSDRLGPPQTLTRRPQPKATSCPRANTRSARRPVLPTPPVRFAQNRTRAPTKSCRGMPAKAPLTRLTRYFRFVRLVALA